jgi:hypothetical protein
MFLVCAARALALVAADIVCAAAEDNGSGDGWASLGSFARTLATSLAHAPINSKPAIHNSGPVRMVS